MGFSDHMIIFCTRKLCTLKIGEHKSVKMRSLNNYDKTVFNNSLYSVYWNSIYIYIYIYIYMCVCVCVCVVGGVCV